MFLRDHRSICIGCRTTAAPSRRLPVLQGLVLCSGDYVELLLSRKVDELNRIAGYTNREVCVLWLLRVLHRILQLLYAEDIHI